MAGLPLKLTVLQSILFSCFEAWLISSAHSLGLPDHELSSILSRCTFVNGLVAATSGVFSNSLVSYFGTVKAPFVASAACLGLAAIAIRTTWGENYGEQGGSHKAGIPLTNGDAEASQPLVDGDGGALDTLSTKQAVLAILSGRYNIERCNAADLYDLHRRKTGHSWSDADHVRNGHVSVCLSLGAGASDCLETGGRSAIRSHL